MMRNLSAWRDSRGGTILFYSYLVAIFAVAVVLMFALSNISDQSNTLKETVHRLDVANDRSCRAINGALFYWSSERDRVYQTLADQTSSPSARERASARLLSLNRVLSQGAKLECEANR